MIITVDGNVMTCGQGKFGIHGCSSEDRRAFDKVGSVRNA